MKDKQEDVIETESVVSRRVANERIKQVHQRKRLLGAVGIMGSIAIYAFTVTNSRWGYAALGAMFLICGWEMYNSHTTILAIDKKYGLVKPTVPPQKVVS